MRSDKSKSYHTHLLADILYSSLITCIVEVFLVANVTLVCRYFRESGHSNELLSLVFTSDIVVVLVYVILGIIIFSGVFVMLQRRSLRYIELLSSAMQNISEGDLNTSVEVVGDDEFSSMAANLNKMVEDIRVLMDKERESERTKNELITNIAHDLRTPLTSIIGYLELLSRKTTTDPKVQEKYIEIAYVKAKRLQKLMEDLFSFTKLNYGKISMNVARVDIVKLLSQLLEEFYPNFAEKKLSYDLQSNVPSRMIQADPNLLARLFDNLINNAIKYGADGKRITVRIHAGDNVVTVDVINYGKVIPADELPLIFNKFYRVEQSRSSSTGGTGLGLAIAKEIVEIHGGNIQVTSDLSGTVFTVKLKVNFDVNKENFGELE